MDFFRAWNEGQHLGIEYRFPRIDFLWLNVWENHDSRMRTRGMEFSNTPLHGTMTTLIKTPKLLETPAYDWIEGRGQLQKSFQVRLFRI